MKSVDLSQVNLNEHRYTITFKTPEFNNCRKTSAMLVGVKNDSLKVICNNGKSRKFLSAKAMEILEINEFKKAG